MNLPKLSICEGIKGRPHAGVCYVGEPSDCPLCKTLDELDKLRAGVAQSIESRIAVEDEEVPDARVAYGD